MAKANKWIKKHPNEWNKLQRNLSRKRRQLLRMEIINLLGGRCSNPNCLVPNGCSDSRCLQIDHVTRSIKGKYDKHCYERKAKGCEMYYKEVLALIKSGSKDYQLLCANCNWIKRFENNETRPRIEPKL